MSSVKKEEELLPEWIVKRLERLSDNLYSMYQSQLKKTTQPSYSPFESPEPAWIRAEVEKQKTILSMPRLCSGLGEIFDYYFELRRLGYKKKEVAEIFKYGEDAECLRKGKIRLKQLIGPLEKFNRALSRGFEVVNEILKEEVGYSEKEEVMEELVRLLEEYCKAKPFFPR